jgi:hypothetical protein
MILNGGTVGRVCRSDPFFCSSARLGNEGESDATEEESVLRLVQRGFFASARRSKLIPVFQAELEHQVRGGFEPVRRQMVP